jgi:DNA-binding NarL/FixJ family response regulator
MSSLDVDEARVQLDATGMAHWTQIDATARAILGGIAEGMTDMQISEQLGFNVQTVRNRVSKLLEDFSMSNRTQLAVALTRAGLVPFSEHRLFAPFTPETRAQDDGGASR